jgi:hypothetical protein
MILKPHIQHLTDTGREIRIFMFLKRLIPVKPGNSFLQQE